MKYANSCAEVAGFLVEVEDGLLIVSSDGGDMQEMGYAVDSDEAIEMVAQAIADFSYSIAQQLIAQLKPESLIPNGDRP